ncbi:MAG TPA: calcium-binding protein [Bauldia sp.]|nr:calcium-binding protein [Bauldia sp.]
MANLTVGPNSTYPTIAAAMAAAAAGDIVILEAGYSNETTTVTQTGMTVTGDATSTGISLQLGAGVATFTLGGTAPINVLDALDGDAIVGNDGANVITVTGGADSVTGGLGDDRLVVDYHLATGAVTGNSTSNFTEAPGLNSVTIGTGFEHFTVLTGAGADTITTGAGNDIIMAGDGANTITAGQGANFITGGSGADVVVALDGGNFIDGGDGSNTLTSGGGNDVITGGIGADTIVAGGGNDVSTARGGADNVDSGAGTDRLVVDYSAFGTSVTGGVTGGSLAAGYSGQVTTLGGNVVDFTFTENFTITGGSGADVLVVGDGTDALAGGAGNDRFTGAGGDDALDGGADVDTAVFSGARSNYTLLVLSENSIRVIDNRPGSPDGTDTLTDIEFLEFSDQTLEVVIAPIDDDFTLAENGVNAGAVSFQDLNGQSVTYAIAAGADGAFFAIDPTTGALTFKAGPDFEEPTDGGPNNVYNINVSGTHSGGAVETRTIQVTVTNVDGNDINGTKHKDVVNANRTVNGQLKATGEEDLIVGRKGNDKLSGLGGNDTIKGGQGKDKLKGNDGDDLLQGSGGNDKLVGHKGNDDLAGGNGGDKLLGKEGNDVLRSGGGTDVMSGGKGSDTFFFGGNLKQADKVKDFGAGDLVLLDQRSFSSLNAGPLSQADFNQYFTYKNGKLSYDADGSGGDKGFVFAIFANKADIGASDIMLG